MIELLKKYNEIYIKNRSHGQEDKTEVFEFNDRSSKLILSAPHATCSFCNKKEKKADLYTGAIVRYLGEVNNISTIIRQKFIPYRELVSDYVVKENLGNHFYLDIHGFNQDIDYDICLGIGEYEARNYPYVNEIYELIKKYNLKAIINHPNYKGLYGLTGRYHQHFNQPNVIQMELKYALRDFTNQPEIFEEVTFPLFNEIIKCYEK